MKEKNYIQSMMDFPVCNHTLGVTENNIGYVSGILDGGIPFEAELFQYGENNDLQKEISVLMPIIKNRSELDCTQNNKGNVIGFEYEIEINDMSVLTVGMVENGQESDENTIRYYWHGNKLTIFAIVMVIIHWMTMSILNIKEKK